MKKLIKLIGYASVFIAILLLTVFLVWNQFVAPFPIGRYRDLLVKLSSEGYVMVKPEEMNFSESGKHAVLMHDCDAWVDGAFRLAGVERELGVRSTFFLRPDAEYFTQNIRSFQIAELDGFGIGFHYDCLSRTVHMGSLTADSADYVFAEKLFQSQLVYMRSFFNIQSCKSHGDNYNSIINNYYNFMSAEFAGRMNVTDWSAVDNASWIGDAHRVWSEPDVLGNLVVVSMHSEWW